MFVKNQRKITNVKFLPLNLFIVNFTMRLKLTILSQQPWIKIRYVYDR